MLLVGGGVVGRALLCYGLKTKKTHEHTEREREKNQINYTKGWRTKAAASLSLKQQTIQLQFKHTSVCVRVCGCASVGSLAIIAWAGSLC